MTKCVNVENNVNVSTIHICGGKKLEGSIRLQGSKNAALPILAATLLVDGISVLKNCPRIADVKEMLEILRGLGCLVWYEEDKVCVLPPPKLGTHLDKEHIRSMRSSVILLGVLLRENGEVSMEYPGGCVIGERPIDLHIEGLKKMGCVFEDRENMLSAKVDRRGLMGTEITLKFPSVGATENLILAAVKAKGTTKIYKAAKEPEIEHLCNFLNKCGAKIKGAGEDCIHIEGVSQLFSCQYEIPADRIVAGTYLMSALLSEGNIFIENPPFGEIDTVLAILKNMGAEYFYEKGGLYLTYHKPLKAVSVETDVYPGFPTDLQSPMLVLLSRSEGIGRIKEKIYENRFRIVGELYKMNARISLSDNEVTTFGISPLKGASVVARELRGNAALIMAGLCAEGETRVLDCQYVKRGYEDICRDLRLLGARIYEDEEQ